MALKDTDHFFINRGGKSHRVNVNQMRAVYGSGDAYVAKPEVTSPTKGTGLGERRNLISSKIIDVEDNGTETTLTFEDSKDLDLMANEVIMTDGVVTGPFVQTPYKLTTSPIANVENVMTGGDWEYLRPLPTMSETGNGCYGIERGQGPNIFNPEPGKSCQVDPNGRDGYGGVSFGGSGVVSPTGGNIWMALARSSHGNYQETFNIRLNGTERTWNTTYDENNRPAFIDTGLTTITKVEGTRVSGGGVGLHGFKTKEGKHIVDPAIQPWLVGVNLTFDDPNPDLRYFKVDDQVQAGVKIVSTGITDGSGDNKMSLDGGTWNAGDVVEYQTNGGVGTIVSFVNNTMTLTNTGNRDNRWIAENIAETDFFLTDNSNISPEAPNAADVVFRSSDFSGKDTTYQYRKWYFYDNAGDELPGTPFIDYSTPEDDFPVPLTGSGDPILSEGEIYSVQVQYVANERQAGEFIEGPKSASGHKFKTEDPANPFGLPEVDLFYNELTHSTVVQLNVRRKYGISTDLYNSVGIYELTEQPNYDIVGFIKEGTKYRPIRDYKSEIGQLRTRIETLRTLIY